METVRPTALGATVRFCPAFDGLPRYLEIAVRPHIAPSAAPAGRVPEGGLGRGQVGLSGAALKRTHTPTKVN